MTKDRALLIKIWAITAIMIGTIGGLICAVLGVLGAAASGFGEVGCNGDGCRAALLSSVDRSTMWIDVGMFGGGGLIVAGIVAVVAANRAARASA